MLEIIWKSSNHKQEHAVQYEGFYSKKILNNTQMMNYVTYIYIPVEVNNTKK